MFDIFYFGKKPNLFDFERPADSLENAAKLSRTKHYWYIYGGNDYTNFDFDWRPAPWEEHQIHVWGNQWQQNGELYFVNKNTCSEKIFNYRKEQIVHRLPISEYWHVPDYIDTTSIDWRWCPDPGSPPYIYHFPSQWQSASGLTYTVPGAQEIKLVNDFVVKALPRPEKFNKNLAVANFDYSWHPNALDQNYCYVFGNQWNNSEIEPTVVYNPYNSNKIKYCDDLTAILAQDITPWKILNNITKFDFSWRPNPFDPPYIYVFGNQWLSPEVRPVLEYHVPGAEEKKFIHHITAQRLGQPEKFETLYECEFDYSWEPDPGSPPYIYIFGNQHWPPQIMPTIRYKLPGATELKFVEYPYAKLKPSTKYWRSLTDLPFEFDFSWCPDPGDPPYIYHFGNQWYPAEEMPTVEYRPDGATQIKFIDAVKAKLLPNMENWTIPEEIDTTNVDFSWIPHPKDKPFIYHFGSEFQVSTGLTYTTPGATELKFINEVPLIKKEKNVLQVLEIFYIDRHNPLSKNKYEKLKELYPKIQKIRYANTLLDTIKRCVQRSTTSKFWVISSTNNYENFDFAWHAEPWQNYMTHVFPSQWNKWSDTFLINKYEFERHSKWAKGLEEFPNLNFVKNQTVQSSSDGSNIYYVDHGNQTDQLPTLLAKYPKIKTTRFVDNYLDTFKRIMSTADTEYVWIVNSICDYKTFDFTWHPEAWQSEMIHVFPSGTQKRGDTFYIHVESFKKQMYELEILDWFNVINYCEDQYVLRYETPEILYEGDSIVDIIKSTAFNFPYAIFANKQDNKVIYPPSPCLWSVKDRIAAPLSSNYGTSLIPRDIKNYINTQVYDYPYVSKDNLVLHRSKELDIVFISNGEPDEELMFHHTEYMVNRPVKWVRGINGRVAAYQAAARASDTPWFFAVFAKLQVVGSSFPWETWQPDYWQEPKHYIFNARNPVNGLEYGHQGMIAYNKKLALANNNPGIDFTLSQPHESVPLLSGTAQFNQDPWTTWRTAFREVVKLKHFMATQPTVETEYRLDTWLTKAQGDYAEWCLRGAHDAVNYYAEVGGNYEKLMCSFEWEWLKERFNNANNF
jgi:hypothetical protein